MTPRPTECTGGCFVCCNESEAEIRAKGEVEHDRIVMIGAYVLALGYLACLAYFKAHDQTFEIPEVLLGCIAGPFTGKAVKKVREAWNERRVKRLTEKEKKYGIETSGTEDSETGPG